MLWVIGTLAYLVFGYGVGRYVYEEFNNHTPSTKLVWYRAVLRKITYPLSFMEWEKRSKGDTFLNGREINDYLLISMFFWPFIRFFPFFSAVVMTFFSLLHRFVAAISNGSLKGLHRVFNFLSDPLSRKVNYLKKFEEEVRANKSKVEEIVSFSQARLEHVCNLLAEAEAMLESDFPSKAASLINCLSKRKLELQGKITSAGKILGEIRKAEKQISDQNRLMILYRKTADIVDTSRDEEELFRAALATIEGVRKASLKLSQDNIVAMLDVEVSLDEVEHAVREDVNLAVKLAAQGEKLIN